jgi:hypothetical protein
MRLIVAAGVMLTLLLCVEGYLRFSGARDVVAPTQYIPPEEATGAFAVELTLSFEAVADDFALEPQSLLLKLDGKELLRRADNVPADVPLLLEDVQGVHVGSNEFLIEVAPNSQASSAVRIRILRDHQVVAEQTIWAAAGEALSDTLALQIAPLKAADTPQKHDHD